MAKQIPSSPSASPAIQQGVLKTDTSPRSALPSTEDAPRPEITASSFLNINIDEQNDNKENLEILECCFSNITHTDGGKQTLTITFLNLQIGSYCSGKKYNHEFPKCITEMLLSPMAQMTPIMIKFIYDGNFTSININQIVLLFDPVYSRDGCCMNGISEALYEMNAKRDLKLDPYNISICHQVNFKNDDKQSPTKITSSVVPIVFPCNISDEQIETIIGIFQRSANQGPTSLHMISIMNCTGHEPNYSYHPDNVRKNKSDCMFDEKAEISIIDYQSGNGGLVWLSFKNCNIHYISELKKQIHSDCVIMRTQAQISYNAIIKSYKEHIVSSILVIFSKLYGFMTITKTLPSGVILKYNEISLGVFIKIWTFNSKTDTDADKELCNLYTFNTESYENFRSYFEMYVSNFYYPEISCFIDQLLLSVYTNQTPLDTLFIEFLNEQFITIIDEYNVYVPREHTIELLSGDFKTPSARIKETIFRLLHDTQ